MTLFGPGDEGGQATSRPRATDATDEVRLIDVGDRPDSASRSSDPTPPVLAAAVPGDAPDPGLAEGGRTGRLRRIGRFVGRHRRGLGAGLLTIALLGAGAVGGWWLRGATDDDTELTIEVDRPVAEANSGQDIADGAPNVIGLDTDAARQVMFDAGLTADDVEVVDVPAAGSPGVIVRQEPNPGSPVDGAVVLGVSVAADMPNLIGQSEAEARSALDELGARVVIEAVYRDGAEEGAVLSTRPAAGVTVPLDVTVQVAAPPSSVYLATLEAVDSDCYEDDVEIDGEALPSSLMCDLGDEASGSDYALNRQISRLQATVGQSDVTDQGHRVRFLVIADGLTLFDRTLPLGEGVPVDLDLVGVLRVQLRAVRVGGGDCCPDVTAGFGSARLVGGPDAIDAIIDRSGG